MILSLSFPQAPFMGRAGCHKYFISTNIMSNAQEPTIVPAETKKPPRRRWLTWTLLSIAVVICALSTWLGIILYHAYHQRQVVAKIEALGGSVIYDGGFFFINKTAAGLSPPGPAILRWIFGDDVFADVANVHFSKTSKDKDLEILKDLPNLKVLRLYDPVFTNEGLKIVSTLPTLETLSIEDTKITDEGLKTLGSLPNLQYLQIYNAEITDEGLKFASKFPNLKGLSLYKTNITGEGLENFVPNKKLEKLTLQGPEINDFTLKHINNLTSLRELSLSDTSITDDGIAHIGGLSQLRSLVLYMNPQITDVGVIGQLTNLEDLTIKAVKETDDNSTPSIVAKGFDQWKRFPKLKQLIIIGGPFNDKNMEMLKDSKDLTFLILGRTQITDAGMVHLQALTQLEYLSLGFSNIGDQGLAYLKALNNLKHLLLYGTRVSKTGLDYLKGLKKLENIHLWPPITKSDILELSKALPDCKIRIFGGDEGTYTIEKDGNIEVAVPIEPEPATSETNKSDNEEKDSSDGAPEGAEKQEGW
jgi:internalin A